MYPFLIAVSYLDFFIVLSHRQVKMPIPLGSLDAVDRYFRGAILLHEVRCGGVVGVDLPDLIIRELPGTFNPHRNLRLGGVGVGVEVEVWVGVG